MIARSTWQGGHRIETKLLEKLVTSLALLAMTIVLPNSSILVSIAEFITVLHTKNWFNNN
jgi:hypothetical protein